MLKSLFKSRKNNSQKHPKRTKPYEGPVELLLLNGCIVTCDSDSTIIENGVVAVSDGKIVEIAREDATSSLKERASTVVDAKGRIIMPGLINTHCHAGDSLFRGLVEGLALEPWLEKLWIAETAILNTETIKLGSQLGFAENLLNGVTTVMDMFWEPAEILGAAESLGVRVATGGIFFDPPGIDGATADQREGLARTFFEEYRDHPNLLPSISAHAAYTVSPESLKTALKVRDEFDTLITIHAAETKAEQQTIKDQYGTSVIRHLHNVGLLSAKAVLAHCVHLDDDEIDILANSKATASHNPASNLKLGSGIARIPDMLKNEVKISLGTDGAVSGNDLDMWNAIRLAAILHNGATQNALALSPRDAIDMATLNGAQALGIEEEAGSLEIGKRADIILINPRQLHAVPVFDPINYLAYAAAGCDVEDVFIAGKQVVRNRKILNLDIDELIDRVNHLKPAIQNSLTN